MPENKNNKHKNDEIHQLNKKLQTLLKKQEILTKQQNNFSEEMWQLRAAIANLTRAAQKDVAEDSLPQKNFDESFSKEKVFAASTAEKNHENNNKPKKPLMNLFKNNKPSPLKSDLEKFVGENLISKIGILSIILGVGIGAKYAIDHHLISPLTRIILGYLSGLGLLAFAVKLKSKYHDFSAVLLSGSLTILYFITYFAYAFYALMPQFAAFLLMTLFTVFTVLAATNYNKQVIAHIGLVGAYTVPFLLSQNSDNMFILFSYMSIINTGILLLAVLRYWKPLYYSAFGLTWLVYLSWYVFDYQSEQHFSFSFFGALFFLLLFFLIFYAMFLANKLLHKEKLRNDGIAVLLLNSFLFYGVGYSLLSSYDIVGILALFTVSNALIHFIVSVFLYRLKATDRNIFYFTSGLVLVFVTIAIPIQWDGNWVTLLWTAEAALLFWIGRSKAVAVYEKLSYPLMALGFVSMLQDWGIFYRFLNFVSDDYGTNLDVIPFANIYFLSSLLFVSAFLFINILNNNKKYTPAFSSRHDLQRSFSFSVAAVFLFSLYYAFYEQIALYRDQLYQSSQITIASENLHYFNKDLLWLKKVWLIDYSLFFVTALAWLNFKKLKNNSLALINLALTVLVMLVFLTLGLQSLLLLKTSYMQQTLAEYYNTGTINILIRYISLGFVAVTFYVRYRCSRAAFTQAKSASVTFDALLYFSLWWLASSELLYWSDSATFYKIALSILWGLYSLFLIAMGIWQKKKYLRVAAIVLFALTLVKLFFYDIAHLSTIAKTIVFVVLGVLLLLISFLYNKYARRMEDEKTED